MKFANVPKALVTVTLQAQIQWHAKPSDTSKRWIGICEPMNLAMEADSLDELHSVINETLNLVLTDLLRENELETYLRERGWRAVNMPANPKQDVDFEVPWELIVAGGRRDSERRAY